MRRESSGRLEQGDGWVPQGTRSRTIRHDDSRRQNPNLEEAQAFSERAIEELGEEVRALSQKVAEVAAALKRLEAMLAEEDDEKDPGIGRERSSQGTTTCRSNASESPSPCRVNHTCSMNTARNVGVAIGLVVCSLLVSAAGYHFTEGLPRLDAC